MSAMNKVDTTKTPKSKRALSTSSTESTTLDKKRQRQRSKQSVVADITEDDFLTDEGTDSDDSIVASEGRAQAPATTKPVQIDWTELLDVMTIAFNNVDSPFTKGLTQVIDRSEKLNLAHERLDQLETKIALNDATVHAITDELENLNKRLSDKDAEIDELKAEMEELKDGMSKVVDKQAVHDAQNVDIRLDELDQYGRRNMLRLSGVPEPNEIEDTKPMVIELFKEKLNVTLQPSDIDRTHRLGAFDKSRKFVRAIVVKFTNYDAREAVFSQRKRLFGSGLYLNDHLTTIRARLMYIARQYKKKNLLTNVWSAEGRVLIRDTKDKTHAIFTKEELAKFDPKGLCIIPDDKGVLPPSAPPPLVPPTATAPPPVAPTS